MDNKPSKKCFVSRNKLPLVILSMIYLGVFYILTTCLVQNDIRVVSQVGNKIVIEVEKK